MRNTASLGVRAVQSAVLAALLAGAGLHATSTTPAAPLSVIPDQTLRYAVSYKNRNAGKVAIVIRNEDHGYTVTSTAKPSLLASFFIKAHTSNTRFVRHRGEVVLHSGTETLARDDQYRRGFRFNRSQSRIEFSNGKHDPIRPGDRFEAAAFPLLLMLRPLDGIADTEVREVSFKRTRNYRYAAPVAETVSVPAGEFPSWQISRHRSDRPADSVRVWLRRSGDPVPLKIAVHKRGATTILVLIDG